MRARRQRSACEGARAGERGACAAEGMPCSSCRGGVDGGWWTKMLASGTFDGEPFTPMPDKLPALEKTGKAWEIGPEIFTVYTDESGEKITRITVEAQSQGALVGPPGIYVACGGKLG